MANEHPRTPTQSETTQSGIAASVEPNRDGGWLTVVNLGDGASLTKWFPSRDEAQRYPAELVAWLNQGRE
jgi:hypothetical protein